MPVILFQKKARFCFYPDLTFLKISRRSKCEFNTSQNALCYGRNTQKQNHKTLMTGSIYLSLNSILECCFPKRNFGRR